MHMDFEYPGVLLLHLHIKACTSEVLTFFYSPIYLTPDIGQLTCNYMEYSTENLVICLCLYISINEILYFLIE